jgi:hypothetical protein
MRATSLTALSLLLATAFATAQSSQHPPAPEDLGTVSGHITCNDTQRVARLADVRLVPTSISLPPKDAKNFGEAAYNAYGNSVPAVETDMNGGFTIHNVHPGQYYLRVDLAGYVSPLLQFTAEQLAEPTPAIRQRMDRELQIVTVAPHATVQADATIIRGASVSGAVLYDDGSPAIGIGMGLLRPDDKGEYKQRFPDGSNTDDHGHYRFDSVPEGKYVVEATLSLSQQKEMTIPMPGTSNTMQIVMSTTVFSLPVYSGDALRRHDAKPVEAATGQETPDTNITLPISQLHDVSGTLIATDGHTINAGKVALLHADDREELGSVDVSDDGMFHFAYIPEGDYILSVQSASDVTPIEVPNPPGATPRTHTETKTLHTYGTTEQPLKVQSDMQSILVTIPEKGASQTSTAASP